MGMFDFLKKDDEAEDGYDEDEEAYSSKNKKNARGSSLRSISAEESANADRLAGEAGSRFSTDYRSYLIMARAASVRFRRFSFACSDCIFR